MTLPADYRIIREGLYVSYDALDKIEEMGPPNKWHDVSLIGDAFANPLRRFKGLERPGFDDALCVIALPSHRHDNEGNRIDRQPGRLFCVYATLEMYGYVVFDWEWKLGNENTGALFDGDQIFGEQTWPKKP